MNYTTLIGGRQLAGSLQQWVNHARLPSAAIVDQAQSWIFRRLRVPEMQSAISGTLAIGDDHILLPARFLAPCGLWLTSPVRSRLKQRDSDAVEAARDYDSAGALVRSLPRMFYQAADRLQFEAAADATYGWRMTYFAEPARLSREVPGNFLTDRHQSLLMWACMAFAHEFLKDWPAREQCLTTALIEIQTANAEAAATLSGVEATILPR